MDFTIENIRKFVKKYPKNAICAAWSQMLDDMDRGEEEYTEDDFEEEADYQFADDNLPPRSAVQLADAFPGTFYFDE